MAGLGRIVSELAVEVTPPTLSPTLGRQLARVRPACLDRRRGIDVPGQLQLGGVVGLTAGCEAVAELATGVAPPALGVDERVVRVVRVLRRRALEQCARVVVTEGEIELTVDGKVFTLATGDSFSFSAELPHRFRNPGSSRASIVWANTPVSLRK